MTQEGKRVAELAPCCLCRIQQKASLRGTQGDLQKRKQLKLPNVQRQLHVIHEPGVQSKLFQWAHMKVLRRKVALEIHSLQARMPVKIDVHVPDGTIFKRFAYHRCPHEMRS